MQGVGHQGAPVGPVQGRSNLGSRGPCAVTSPRPSSLSPPGVSAAVPFWVRGGEAGTAIIRTAQSVPRRQLFSRAAVGGSRGDGDRCGSPSPGQKWEGGLRGLFPGWKPPPPPRQIPPRGRAGAGSAGGSGRRQCDFTRPPGLGFPSRGHEIQGFASRGK